MHGVTTKIYWMYLFLNLATFDIIHETSFLHVITPVSAVCIMWFGEGLNIIVYEW